MSAVFVACLDSDRFTWTVEIVSADEPAAPKLERDPDRLVYLPGLSWINVPLRLREDGDLAVGAQRMRSGAKWGDVERLCGRILDDDLLLPGNPTYQSCRAFAAAAHPRPGHLPERTELMAEALMNDWARPRTMREAEGAWSRASDGKRASWRRRASMFLHLVDAGSAHDPQLPGKALAFAWMTEFENRMAWTWLAHGGWDGEPLSQIEVWLRRADRALKTVSLSEAPHR